MMFSTRVEGQLRIGDIMHRQHDAGDDLHAQAEGEDAAEGVPEVQVPRRREGRASCRASAAGSAGAGRASARNRIWDCRSKGRTCLFSSADLDAGVGQEGVRRHRQILRRRAFADAAGGVVLRAMAVAEPAAVIAFGTAAWNGGRAAQMGADADQDQPFRLDGAVGVGGRRAVGQIGVARQRDRAARSQRTALASAISSGVRRRTNSGWPRHLTTTCWPGWTGGNIDFDGGQRQRGGGRVHLVDERPGRRGDADRAHRARRHIKKIAPRARVMRRSCHVDPPFEKSEDYCDIRARNRIDGSDAPVRANPGALVLSAR